MTYTLNNISKRIVLATPMKNTKRRSPLKGKFLWRPLCLLSFYWRVCSSAGLFTSTSEITHLQPRILKQEDRALFYFHCVNEECLYPPNYVSENSTAWVTYNGTRRAMSVFVYLTDVDCAGWEVTDLARVIVNRDANENDTDGAIIPSETLPTQTFLHGMENDAVTGANTVAVLGVYLNTTGLLAGVNYNLCIDYDGVYNNSGFNDTNLDMFIGGPYETHTDWLFQSTEYIKFISVQLSTIIHDRVVSVGRELSRKNCSNIWRHSFRRPPQLKHSKYCKISWESISGGSLGRKIVDGDRTIEG